MVITALVVPWNCFKLNPRAGMRIWASFIAFMEFFYLMDTILIVLQSNVHECMRMVGDILNTLFYALILYIVVNKDAQYWLKHETILDDNFMDNLGKIVKPKQKISPFPKIRWSEIELGPKIGHGGYAIVYIGSWKGIKVAVKEITITKTKEKLNILRDMISESSLLSSLRHPNIVAFLGLVVEKEHLALVIEYMPGGSLWDMLRKIDMGQVTELTYQMKIDILLDVAKGINYLHGIHPPVIHRDLKSANVLIDSKFNCKVADFGLSRVMNEESEMTQIGTIMWAAPEVLLGKPYNEKVDVWGFGILTWELVTNKVPYEDIPNQHLIWKTVTEDRKKLEIPGDTPVLLTALMKKCWLWDYNKRPSMENIIEALEKNNRIYLTMSKPNSTDLIENIEDILPKSNEGYKIMVTELTEMGGGISEQISDEERISLLEDAIKSSRDVAKTLIDDL